MQRQGRSRGDARKAPAASPSLVQPAPSWAGSLSARQVWARLAQSRASSCQQLCQIGPLSRAGALPYWRRTGAQPSRARAKRGWAASSSLEEARLPASCSLGFQVGALWPPAILGSGAPCPELGLWAGAQARRGRAQPAALVSAGEESAWESTSERQLLGAQGVSLRVCGAADHSQGP